MSEYYPGQRVIALSVSLPDKRKIYESPERCIDLRHDWNEPHHLVYFLDREYRAWVSPVMGIMLIPDGQLGITSWLQVRMYEQ